MVAERPEMRAWIAEALGLRTRHPALETTLFRRLEDIEHGPLVQIGALVHSVVDELRGAQRRLAEQADELRLLRRTVARLTERLDELAGEDAVADGHLLLLPGTSGYRLVDRDGPPPVRGEAVEVEGARLRVVGVGPSPLPDDPRRSALALAG